MIMVISGGGGDGGGRVDGGRSNGGGIGGVGLWRRWCWQWRLLWRGMWQGERNGRHCIINFEYNSPVVRRDVRASD